MFRTVSGHSLSIENQETTEEPVKNLMSAFLLTSTSARYRSSDKLPENVLQNKGPDHHSIRRVEAVNPFHHKKDGRLSFMVGFLIYSIQII